MWSASSTSSEGAEAAEEDRGDKPDFDSSWEVLTWRKTFSRFVGGGDTAERDLERRVAALEEERVSIAKRFGTPF